jgi:signal transduction histidine kinase
MLAPKRKRLFLFILIAILLPAAALIFFAWQLVRQDSELASSRAAQERLTAVEQLRRELLARLDAIRLQEINSIIRGTTVTARPADPSIVLVTTLNDDRMLLPWVSIPGPPGRTPQFARARQNAEKLEFRKNDFNGALVAYRQAWTVAKTLRERCETRLMAGRVLLKAERVEEAAGIYREMIQDCSDTADDFGIRFRLYAMERLITACKDPNPPVANLIEIADGKRWVSPPEAYLVRSLLYSVPVDDAKDARTNIAQQLQRIEQLMALSQDFTRLRPLASQGWVTFGDEPWLISIPPDNPLIFVVSARKLAPPQATLVSKETETSIKLGDGLSGLHVEWQPGRFTPVQRVPASLYIAALALIVGTTVLGGYLLLRDVNRDLRIAELRTQFVASVSHELKTPLTAVRMFAETLMLGRAQDKQTRDEYLATIMNESERLTRLVDNVLDFSKIEQGRKVYHMRTAALPEVVRSAAQAMQYPLEQLGFKLNVSIDENVSPMEADTDALEQAILNLLSNAMKYSTSASEIELRLHSQNGEAVIEVTDHGIGIPAEEQSRIFEKFYRIPSRETEFVAGTGLGLTLVNHIVEAHGGSIEVQSTVGQGSTFFIRLPLGRSEVRT